MCSLRASMWGKNIGYNTERNRWIFYELLKLLKSYIVNSFKM
jgi:hypothetical protein